MKLEMLGQGVEVQGICAGCQAAWDAAELEHRLARFEADLIRASDADERLRPFAIDTYPGDDDAKRAALEWLEGVRAGGRSNLYLWGDAGRGKSGLAWGLARQIVEDAVRADAELERLAAVFVNFRLLLARIKDGFGERERGETVSRYFSVKVLVLDDLGSERPTDFNRDELLNLIDTRYERRLATVFTSNMRLSQLAEKLTGGGDPVDGRRIVSRISEDVVRVEVCGSDLRLGR